MRRLFSLLILILLPALGVGAFSWQQLRCCEEALMEMEAIYGAGAAKQRRQHLNRCARATFQGADHFYIDKELEMLSFCEGERAEIEGLLAAERSLPDRKMLDRLQRLRENRLAFSEESVERFSGVQETVEKSVKPVELDEQDLVRLLACIEGAQGQGRPQLLITDCQLKRKERGVGTEVFEMDLKLLKREFE